MAKSFGYAAAGFGVVLGLAILSFLRGGAGHGTALFGLIALAPGSFGGDDEWAATGFLFWPLVGFLLGQAERRGRRAAIVLLMAAHYAVAVFHLSQFAMDGGVGLARAWSALPVQVVLFCLVYAAANIAVWMVAFRKPADRA